MKTAIWSITSNKVIEELKKKVAIEKIYSISQVLLQSNVSSQLESPFDNYDTIELLTNKIYGTKKDFRLRFGMPVLILSNLNQEEIKEMTTILVNKLPTPSIEIQSGDTPFVEEHIKNKMKWAQEAYDKNDQDEYEHWVNVLKKCNIDFKPVVNA